MQDSSDSETEAKLFFQNESHLSESESVNRSKDVCVCSLELVF